MLDEKKAIEIAKKEIKGKVDYGSENPVTVRLVDGKYLVTFETLPKKLFS